ncbi:hypothetical protein, partial [Leptolyngbya sp. FACHB-8]|uniref:hypothetical protein n=1 Tax=unclassified Leptolyngbya TaxID=2650499 RepID=UPI001A7E22C8
ARRARTLSFEAHIAIKSAAILILKSGPKTARRRRAVFGPQSQEFTPVGRELLALKPILL